MRNFSSEYDMAPGREANKQLFFLKRIRMSNRAEIQ